MIFLKISSDINRFCISESCQRNSDDKQIMKFKLFLTDIPSRSCSYVTMSVTSSNMITSFTRNSNDGPLPKEWVSTREEIREIRVKGKKAFALTLRFVTCAFDGLVNNLELISNFSLSDASNLKFHYEKMEDMYRYPDIHCSSRFMDLYPRYFSDT